jgi:hypothetical protein
MDEYNFSGSVNIENVTYLTVEYSSYYCLIANNNLGNDIVDEGDWNIINSNICGGTITASGVNSDISHNLEEASLYL